MHEDSVGSKWWTTSGGDVKNRDEERGIILSWPPKLIPVREGRWFLAAPSGQIHADPDWAIFSLSLIPLFSLPTPTESHRSSSLFVTSAQ